MVFTSAAICRVASAERSASRCTSSATTEKPARFTGGGRLDGGVQRQHVGLFGNVGNQLGDFADLLRGFAQPLDALGGFLDLLADGVHAVDGVGHRLAAGVRGFQRLTGHRGGLLRLCRHLVDAHGHLQHRLAGFADLAQLLGGRRQQLGGGLLHLLGGSVTRAAVPCTWATRERSSSTV
jgi:hypothetical protein